MKEELKGNPGPESTGRPVYEPPRVQELDQKDVLKTLQITSAGATWWTS
jgi:hypothetical protein